MNTQNIRDFLEKRYLSGQNGQMIAQKLEPFYYFAAGDDFAVFIVGVRAEKGLVPDFLSMRIIVNNNPVEWTDAYGLAGWSENTGECIKNVFGCCINRLASFWGDLADCVAGGTAASAAMCAEARAQYIDCLNQRPRRDCTAAKKKKDKYCPDPDAEPPTPKPPKPESPNSHCGL